MEQVFQWAAQGKFLAQVVADRPIPGSTGDGCTFHGLEHGSGGVDDYIVEHLSTGDVVLTRDYGLARRALDAGAHPLNDRGTIWNHASLAKQERDLAIMTAMRAGGMRRGSLPAYQDRDLRVFRRALKRLIGMTEST